MTQAQSFMTQAHPSYDPSKGGDISHPTVTKQQLLEALLQRKRDERERARSLTLATQKSSITSDEPNVIERKINVSTRSITKHVGSVGTYKAKKGEYYRYSYRQGKKVKHIHLGPTKCPATKAKVERIRIAISQGIEPEKIIAWYCKK